MESVIGRGAMGIVYKAHDPAIDRAVAIKLVRADLLDGDDRTQFLERFRREAQAAGRCAHPNIVAVYDFALHDGSPFIAMEYLASTSLAQVLAAQSPLGAARALPIMRQVLAALGAAHRAGVIHRDIKPANILLAAGDLTKVTDFGVARLDRSDMTQSGSMIGTLAYMSPEQCRGDPLDGRSDLFSAASVLYEALAGERAFPGRTETQVIQNLLAAEPAALDAAPGPIPDRLVPVLRRALAKDPAARYPAAEDFAAALASAAAGGSADTEDEATRVARRSPPPAAPLGDNFEAATLATLERRLAHYVGPIARHLVATAARGAGNLDALYATLASQIESETDRRRFLGEMPRPAAPPGGTATRAPTAAPPSAKLQLSAETLEAARLELARHIGPIAQVVLRKALQKAANERAFWEDIASHIDTESERKNYLRRFSNKAE